MSLSARDLERLKAALAGDARPEPTAAEADGPAPDAGATRLRFSEASLQTKSDAGPVASDETPKPARETIYQRLRRAKPIAETVPRSSEVSACAAIATDPVPVEEQARGQGASVDWLARVAALRARAEAWSQESPPSPASDQSPPPSGPATVELVSLRRSTKGSLSALRALHGQASKSRTGPFRWLV